MAVWGAFGGGVALGGSIVVPPGVGPGQTFQLAFVTSMTITATSHDVADYDAFVAAAAHAAGLDEFDGVPVTWSAIVSTATVDARDHAPQSAPVYTPDGRLVTGAAGGLWNARLRFLENPIDMTETGERLDYGLAWTGTDALGRARPSYELGSRFAAGVGDLSSIFTTWASAAVLPPTYSLRLYALSSPIHVVAVPEPASAVGAALAVGLVGAASAGRRGRRASDGLRVGQARRRATRGRQPVRVPSPR